MSGIDELRADLALERGLPDGAESFLTASTLDELEEQADALARTLGTTRATPEPEPAPAPDPITVALRSKAERKRQLLAMFTGGRQRDERGRFARSASFDGGSRVALPQPTNPVEDHDQLITELAHRRRLFGGGDF